MNDTLIQLRRDRDREAELKNRNILKGTRWPVLKHTDHPLTRWYKTREDLWSECGFRKTLKRQCFFR